MRDGDLVRFRLVDHHEWSVGLLVQYETWEKVARILHSGEIVSVHASNVQLHKRLYKPSSQSVALTS